MEKKLWVRVPMDFIGKLSCNALIVLSLLLNQDADHSHTVYFKRPHLAQRLQCSLRTLDSYLSELEQAGLILERTRTQTAVCARLAPDILPPRTHSAQTAQPKPQSRQTACSSIDPDDLMRLMDPYGCASPSRK